MNSNTTKQNIPNGWQVKTLGDVGRVSMCKRVMKNQTKESGDIPFFKIGTFGKKPDAYISKELYEEFKNKYSFPNKGDVLISASGTIGRTVVYDGQPAYYQDSNIIWIANNEDVVINSYLRYLYDRVQWQTASGTIARLYNDNVRRIEITAPQISEQKRIVSVLETWDDAISSLSKTIALKREVKKGLMQKLLAGELRLPGFKDEWKKYNLGDMGNIVSGGTPDTLNPENWSNQNVWVTPTDITKLKNYKYISSSEKMISDIGIKNSSATIIPPNSLILCSRATIAECAINTVELCTNQGFKSFVPKIVDVEFLYYWVKQNKKKFKRISAGSTFLEFNKKDMERIEIKAPTLDEQKEIAEILSSIDREIEVLLVKRKLLTGQKKYLLNNLVTGQIRTPENL